MIVTERANRPPDYGVDAPTVVRNLFVAGAVGVSGWVVTTLVAGLGRVNVPKPALVVAGMGLTTGIGCSLMAAWMLWHSKIGKVRSRERLLERIEWAGDERVLDAGCGRGLLVNGAARRLLSGRATGIDIWQAEDLTGNSPDAALENARREGVEDRVDIQTADLRNLPFADETFDVVLSHAVIHNLYAAPDRDRAIREIARVMKPGGRALVEDIRHHHQYTRTFRDSGCGDVRQVGSVVTRVFLMCLTFGSLRPATLVVRKNTR